MSAKVFPYAQPLAANPDEILSVVHHTQGSQMCPDVSETNKQIDILLIRVTSVHGTKVLIEYLMRISGFSDAYLSTFFTMKVLPICVTSRAVSLTH